MSPRPEEVNMMRNKARRRAVVAGGAAAVAKHRANKSGQTEAADQPPPPVAEDPQDTPTDAPAPQAGSDDMVTELQNLKKLLDEGVLTQAEFDMEKQKILSGS
jgi:hypothetical protein